MKHNACRRAVALVPLLTLAVLAGPAAAMALEVVSVVPEPGNHSNASVFEGDVMWRRGSGQPGVGDIFITDLATGRVTPVASGTIYPFASLLSHDWAAWRADAVISRETGLPASVPSTTQLMCLDGNRLVYENGSLDVVDLVTGTRTSIPQTTDAAYCAYDHPWAVWQGWSKVYAYQMGGGVSPSSLHSNSGSPGQLTTGVFGNRAVWRTDYSSTPNSVYTATLPGGVPELLRRVSEGVSLQVPTIAGDWVVWEECGAQGDSLYGCYLPTRTVVEIVRLPISSLVIHRQSASWIVWEQRVADDRIDIFACRLSDVAAEHGIVVAPPSVSNPLPEITLSLGPVFEEGSTSASVGTCPPAPSGYRLVGDYYDLETTAVFGEATVTVSYEESDLSGAPEQGLRLFQWKDRAWNDITESLDTAGNSVTGEAYSVWPVAVMRPTSAAELMGVHRFYNKRTGTHFYTSDPAEAADVAARLSTVYSYEGIAYYVDPVKNATPLYRFFNRRTGTHLYTADEGEKNNILATLGGTYSLDGVAYRVSLGGGTEVHRFYSPAKGVHFYSADPAEVAYVRAALGSTWRYEGRAYYVGQ